MLLLEGIVFAILVLSTASDVNNQTHCAHSTCHAQMKHLSSIEEDCFIKKIPSASAVCKNLPLKMNGANDLGRVVLHHYLFSYRTTYFTTGLNSTFSNIKWTRLRMQYVDRANSTFNFCREIQLNPKLQVPANLSLFYDCLWSLDHEDVEFDFKYETFDSRSKIIAGRHYIFKVPRHYYMLPDRPLNMWPVFMYMDITELPILTLHWEIRKEIVKFRVIVNVNGKRIQDQIISGNLNQYGQYSYSHDVGVSSGKIYFSVQVIDEECNGSCQVFLSPVINIENVSNQPLLIGIVGSIILLPVFLYSLYVWKRYSLFAVDSVPVVLLVYKRSLRSHTQAVVAFAKYLRDFCRVNALVDELDIPLTKTKDPHEWYQESFSQADVVLVISSPPSGDPLEAGIYQKVDILALRILSEKYCDPSCKQRYFSLLFPYCSHDDIPTQAKNLRCYSIKKDLNELLWHLRYGFKCYCASKIDYMCYHSQIPGGNSDFWYHGKFVLDAFQVAEEDVKKRTSLSKKIADDDFEQIPLQEVISSENSDHSEVSQSLLWLKYDIVDRDNYKEDTSAVFLEGIQNLNLSGGENKSCTSSESECQHRNDIHKIDLNYFAL